MQEMVAFVNEEGKFIRQFDGITFDVSGFRTNTNDQQLNERTAKMLGQIHTLQQEYNSLASTFKQLNISELEITYKAKVLECRAAVKKLNETKSMSQPFDMQIKRSEQAMVDAKRKVSEIRGQRPNPRTFPLESEIAEWIAKVNAAEAAGDKASRELSTHKVNLSMFEYQLQQEEMVLAKLTAEHDTILVKLNRAKGVVSENYLLGTSNGLPLE